jgi:hypothetical protein
VESLRANPSKLIARVAEDLVSLCLVTWVIFIIGYFVFVRPDGFVTIPKVWFGALGGALGGSSRFMIAAITSAVLASHVANFDTFAAKNQKRQERILALLPNATLDLNDSSKQ